MGAACALPREPTNIPPTFALSARRLFQLSNGSNPDKIGGLIDTS
jgi:hypothetical protein